LVDLRPQNLTGKAADHSLHNAGITCNKNGIPFDTQPPTNPSGIRIGSPAGTTRGFGVAEFTQIGDMIAEALDGLAKTNSADNAAAEQKVRAKVAELCARFPVYQGM